jgi:hypothetical protein
MIFKKELVKILWFSIIVFCLLGCDDRNDNLKSQKQKIDYDVDLKTVRKQLTKTNSAVIQPYIKNPRYWQYNGAPLLLIGGSDQDNLFNHPQIWPFGLESHLDLLVSCGGNYIRNTMSSRDYGNLWPFRKEKSGLFDLNRWDENYWHRFENLIRMAHARDIIIQIEIWDRFDFTREPWSNNSFNPKNNINFDSQQSGLMEVIKTHPGEKENSFFRSIPSLENNTILLNYQQRFVEKILSITLKYPNILYCISNETNEDQAWSDYWAVFVSNRAADKGVLIHVTEMYDAWNLFDPQHHSVINKPALYTYLEFSQNNHQQGQKHWDNAQSLITQRLSESPRPVNSVKIYGGMSHGGSFEEGTQKFWRNILGGFASSRFHRTTNPFLPAGIGLSPLAQTQIRSMRMLTDEMNIFACKPSNHLLSEREDNEAYAFSEVGRQYAIYFPDEGAVKLNLSGETGNFSLRWLHIMVSEWQQVEFITGGKFIDLSPPGEGPWVVLIKKMT